MGRIPRAASKRLICAAVVICFACVKPTAETSATAVMVVQPTLIYCDRTPGAVSMAFAYQRGIEQLSQPPGVVRYAVTSEQFIARLSEGGWKDVYVMARHGG